MRPTPDWHNALPREDRIKVCDHVLSKLSSYYRSVPEQVLRLKTSSFESHAFSTAQSRREYLEKIASALLSLQEHVRSQTGCNPNGTMSAAHLKPQCGASTLGDSPMQQSSTWLSPISPATSVVTPSSSTGSVPTSPVLLTPQQPAVLSPEIKAQTPQQTDWRMAQIPLVDRDKVSNHVLEKLCRYFPSVPKRALWEKTLAFESISYSGATNRWDYLEKIAAGLGKVERASGRISHGKNADSNCNGANGSMEGSVFREDGQWGGGGENGFMGDQNESGQVEQAQNEGTLFGGDNAMGFWGDMNAGLGDGFTDV